METDGIRVRINFSTREFEIEGAEASVDKYLKHFASALELIEGSITQDVIRHPKLGIVAPNVAAAGAEDTPVAFGEYLHRFPRDTTDVDKVLIAAFYVQSYESEDDSFSTRSVNSALKEQGIKVTNASECVRRNLQSRRIFALGKGTNRVSQVGKEYLAELSKRGEE